jgi:hypothetical protein
LWQRFDAMALKPDSLPAIRFFRRTIEVNRASGSLAVFAAGNHRIGHAALIGIGKKMQVRLRSVTQARRMSRSFAT